MKSFLLKGKRPIIKWSMLPDETYFEGTVPEGYSLAVMPSGNYIVIDVDRHGTVDGFENVPKNLNYEMANTLKYTTPNNGMHFWFKYSGKVNLANKSTKLGIDLRVGYKGYVVWYPKEDIRDCLNGISETSEQLNEWLEKTFSYV
jgi:hypothetical protein